MSRSGAPIEKLAHDAWFERVLHSDRHVHLMFLSAVRRIGVVRFDREIFDWEANINVAPGDRGRGLGTKMLQLAIAHLLRERPVCSINASIKAENVPSLKIFLKSSFIFQSLQNQIDPCRLRYAFGKPPTEQERAALSSKSRPPDNASTSDMILGVLQARMISTRLPGKVLRPLLERPLIMRQLERLHRTTKIDRVVVATSAETSDDRLAGLQCIGSCLT